MELEYANFAESTAHELVAFAQNPSLPLTPALERLLRETALHGLSCYPWNDLREVLCAKLTDILDNRKRAEDSSSIDGGYEIRRDDLVNKLKQFDGPPFTLQRICEMLTEMGAKHYRTVDKYMFAFEKLVSVTSTSEPLSPEQFDASINELSDTMKKLMSKPASPEGQGGDTGRRLFSDRLPVEESNIFAAQSPDPMVIDT